MNKKTFQRGLSLLLAILIILSTLSTAFAAYDYSKLKKPSEKTNGSFTISEARDNKAGEDIWVLSRFTDDYLIKDCFWKFTEELRIKGVATGDQYGNLAPEKEVTMAQMCVFMLRYFEANGYTGTEIIQGAKIGGDLEYNGQRCDVGNGLPAYNTITGMYPGSYGPPDKGLFRKDCILLCAQAAASHSSGLTLDMFSSTKLGEWASPKENPGGSADIKIYPIKDLSKGDTSLKSYTVEGLQCFKPDEDKYAFKGIYCQAANLLMYCGVLEGSEDTGTGFREGLKGWNITKRAEMIKLLCCANMIIEKKIDAPDDVKCSADLSVSADDSASINYKDLERGSAAEIEATFDGTRSQGDNFKIEGYSDLLGDLGDRGTVVDTDSAYSARRTLTLSYGLKSLTNGDAKDLVGRTVRDTIRGMITATAGSTKMTDDAEARVSISVTNQAPESKFVVTNDRLTNNYKSDFFYINNPATITDSSSDYEAPLASNRYAIYKDGACIAIVDDFADVQDGGWLKNITPNAGNKTISVTFKTPGIYTIKDYVYDECGVQDFSDKTIVVTGEPAPPKAIINTNNYAFVNRATSVKDASTDPNNDIVSWTWGDVEVQKQAVPPTPVEGETPPAPQPSTWATAAGQYTKSGLVSGQGITKPSTVDGSLTFSQKGIYRVHLAVKDATDSSDDTYREIKVIESIPVPDIDVGPKNPDPKPDPDPNPDPTDPTNPTDPDPTDPNNPKPDPDPGPKNNGYPYWEENTLVIKQNRQFTLDISNSLDPPDSPILWDKTEWKLDPIDGYQVNNVKFDTKGSTLKKHSYLAKEPGKFKMTVILHNTYSDNLAIKDPTNPDLKARTVTFNVRVLPDLNPKVALQVNNAKPNFHDNPTSINVKVVATASSPDFDKIDFYDWSLVRDNNSNGDFKDDKVMQSFAKSKQSEIGFNVKFEEGNTNPFEADVKVTEAFGQPTIPEFIQPSDYLTDKAKAVFDVNWIPCISFSMREFAYTDDTLTISTNLKDENVKTCKVDWTLWKKAGTSYTQINTSSFDTWKLTNEGGQLRIPEDGYYRLQAVITDKEGNSETFYPKDDIRIYHLPVAVLSDGPQYRWDNTIYKYKESRKFTLDGNTSYADDSTGPALHKIDRNKDAWSITPLDGQNSDTIYVMNDAKSGRLLSMDGTIFSVSPDKFDETLAILEPGSYEVSYQVTNTYGKKSPVVKQIITIAEDTAPVITGVIEPVVKRGAKEDGANVTLSIANLEIQSNDKDLINDYSIELAYDSNNNKSFSDENWTKLTTGDYRILKQGPGYLQLNVQLQRQNVGDYKFRVIAKDTFGQETLPIVPESERKSTEKIFDTKIDNVRPNGTFSTKTVAMGDVVFAVGESSVAQEIQNSIKSYKNRFGDEAGLNVMDVNVEMVETSKVDAQTYFPWEVYNLYRSGLGTGDGQFSSSGSSYVYQGYGSQAPIDHLYYEDGKTGGRKFTFSIDMTGYNACATVIPGFIFGAHMDNSTMYFTGYIVFMWHDKFTVYKFTAPGGHDSFTSNGSGNIATSGGTTSYDYGSLKFEYLDSVSTISTSLQKYITMDYTGGVLTVTDSGSVVLKKSYSSAFNGYGIAAANSSHGCGMRSYTRFNNLSLETSTVKSLNDALSDVSWRDGAERFVIYADDKTRSEMSSGDTVGYPKLLASLLGENIHLIALGSDANASQLQQLISNLTTSGVYYKNSPHTTALDNSAAFIKSVLLGTSKDTMYVLLNEKLNYNKIYSDYNGDPQWLWEQNNKEAFEKNPSILAQHWKYYHDPNFFDNSLGIADFTSSNNQEKWLSKEITTFNKTGLYKIDFGIKDNPVPNKADNSPNNPFDEYRYWSKNYANDSKNQRGEITNPYAELYVHRRPVAEFNFEAHKSNDVVKSITVTNKAYDLDHQFRDPNKGLNLYEWKWKFASDNGWRGSGTFTSASAGQQWINEQLVNLNTMSMTNIMIQYRVRDIDGYSEKELVNETVKVGSNWVQQQNQYIMNQGVWSEAKTVWITNAAQPPVARFTTDNHTYVLGEKIKVSDHSYSPNGDKIVKWEFTVARNNGASTSFSYTLGQNVSSLADMENNFSSALSSWVDSQQLALADDSNKYKITLVVTDDKAIPLKSNPYSVTILIKAINNPPDVNPPDIDNPDNPGEEDGKGKSILGKNNPTIYEYDSYDENQNNPYYTWGGFTQKRGTEKLDWTLKIHDVDNDDKYGTANNSDRYKVDFKIDRYFSRNRDLVSSMVFSQSFPTKTLTAADAMNNSLIAPFITAKEKALPWGVYQITTAVTDIPNNGSEGKTVKIITDSKKKPLHLYVIPKLDINNCQFSFQNIVNNPEQISPGETITVTAVTNDRSTGCRILYKDGAGKSLKQDMTLASTNSNGTLNWSTQFVIPENLEEEDLASDSSYTFNIETFTTFGSRVGEETRAKQASGVKVNILPLKLFDFELTSVNDPAVKYSKFPIRVANLAFDDRDTTPLMKCGYAFNFNVYSKGLKGNDDTIRIRPTFFGYNTGTGRYDLPLDLYYRNDANQYVLATTDPTKAAATGDTYKIYKKGTKGTALGNLRELNLPTSTRTIPIAGSTQKWSARYGIPGSSVFVRKGQSLAENSLYKGKVLIMFELDAMKSGNPKYDYVEKGQWNLERITSDGKFIDARKAIYKDGSVIVIDSTKNSSDNYESRPVWKK